jgi:hypothetical protein
MARKRLHDQHPHTEVEKGLARVAERHIQHILYCACAGKWPGRGSTISTLTQRWRRGWPLWGRALYTAYTVLRMCREMARKRLHDQHPHTEVEKGLARVAELHLDIKDLLENVLIDLGRKSSALLRF